MKELTLAYGGSFTLCSGEHAIQYRVNAEKGVSEYVCATAYKGTAIGLRFRTDTKLNFEAVRKQILSRGQQEALKIQGAIKKASRSSGGRYHFE